MKLLFFISNCANLFCSKAIKFLSIKEAGHGNFKLVSEITISSSLLNSNLYTSSVYPSVLISPPTNKKVLLFNLINPTLNLFNFSSSISSHFTLIVSH